MGNRPMGRSGYLWRMTSPQMISLRQKTCGLSVPIGSNQPKLEISSEEHGMYIASNVIVGFAISEMTKCHIWRYSNLKQHGISATTWDFSNENWGFNHPERPQSPPFCPVGKGTVGVSENGLSNPKIHAFPSFSRWPWQIAMGAHVPHFHTFPCERTPGTTRKQQIHPISINRFISFKSLQPCGIRIPKGFVQILHT